MRMSAKDDKFIRHVNNADVTVDGKKYTRVREIQFITPLITAANVTADAQVDRVTDLIPVIHDRPTEDMKPRSMFSGASWSQTTA